MGKREHILSAKRIMRAYIKSPESFDARRDPAQPKNVIIQSKASPGDYVYVSSSLIGIWFVSGYVGHERVLDTNLCWSMPLFSLAARFWWVTRESVPLSRKVDAPSARQRLEDDLLVGAAQAKGEV